MRFGLAVISVACAAALLIWGALFSVDLNGRGAYRACWDIANQL